MFRRKEVLCVYVKVLVMYKETKTRVNNVCKKTEDLSAGVSQGLALSPFLFSLIVDAITIEI